MTKKTKTPASKPKKKSKKELAAAAKNLTLAGRNKDQARRALTLMVKAYYDAQQLRLAAGGRLLAPRAAKDVEEGANPIQLHEYDLHVLGMQTEHLREMEKKTLKDIQDQLDTIGFYKDVLSDKTRWRGIGPTMAGVILSSFDIENEEMVSQMWSFSGLAPVHCARCAKCYAVVTVSDDNVWSHEQRMAEGKVCKADISDPKNRISSGKAMRPVRGQKLPYNKWLRSKLVGVLGPVLLKLNSPFRKYYDDYKLRKTQAGWGMSDGHRHNAAIRYMIKQLLREIWIEWRTYEGLSVREPYEVEKLGMRPHSKPPISRKPKPVTRPRTAAEILAAEIDAEAELAS